MNPKSQLNPAESRCPVVTGIGLVTVLGRGMESTWRAIEKGQSGLSSLSLFESPRHGNSLVGEIKESLESYGVPQHGSRSDRLGWLAAHDAWADAGLGTSGDHFKAGILLGSSVGGSFDSERFLRIRLTQGSMRARSVRFHECHSTANWIADSLGLLGPSMTIATACSSSALALATAAEMILSGEADQMLAGGADSLSRMTWGGFHSLFLVDQVGCRPFCHSRAGMSLGEGAALLVLESQASALKRGARIYATLSGWGTSCDAHHVTAPHPEGRFAVEAMNQALARAGLKSSDIDYVNAHGTGTKDNDIAESMALKTVFGDRVPPFSSTKRFFGHALAASGAIEAALSLEALSRQVLLPNPGYEMQDERIGLSPVTRLTPARMGHVMSNSFGFGGNNGVLIFSRHGKAAPMMPDDVRPIPIVGASSLVPRTQEMRHIEPPMPEGFVKVHACEPSPDPSMLSPQQRRRLSRLSKMAVVAAKQCVSSVLPGKTAVAVGTGMGCLADAGDFLENLILKEEREPMPAKFPSAVHNAAGAQIAMDRGAHGLNSTATCGSISFECALWQGVNQLLTRQADQSIVGAADELNNYVLGIGKRWGAWTSENIPGEGAAMFHLGSRQLESGALAHLNCIRLGRYSKRFDAEREAQWIRDAAEGVDVGLIITGSGGFPDLDKRYSQVLSQLFRDTPGGWDHLTYKADCGEFHAASAIGFARAIQEVQSRGKGVILYTLAHGGGKAVCSISP